MPPRRRRALRKRGKRGAKKSKLVRGLTVQQNQFCKVIETVRFQDILPGVQAPDSFNLMEFARARYMANGFQFYKAAKCTWTYEPLYNTYATETGNTGDTVPYIYVTMNRTGDSLLPVTLDAFQAMGAKPVKFIRKHIVSYRPNWVTPGLPIKVVSPDGTNRIDYTLGSKCEYGWINSSPLNARNNVGAPVSQNTSGLVVPVEPLTFAADVSVPSYNVTGANSAAYSVMYNGHNTIFDQFINTGDNQKIGRVTLTVEWHFKCPIWDKRISQNINGPSSEET